MPGAEGMEWEIAGKLCVITGATSGIGEVSALRLAEMGARLVLVGRDEQRIKATTEKIRHEVSDAEIHTELADLSIVDEVRRLSERIALEHPRIDVLLNNAGSLFLDRQETPDGYERTFALNHLSYFLLTSLLLDRLKDSAPSRIVNVASEAHQGARSGLDFDDLHLKQSYGAFKAYSRSKLANVLFTNELARRLEGTGVTANSLHPGVVKTRFGEQNGWRFQIFKPLVNLFSISAEQGAETSIYLCSSPEVAQVTGEYFAKNQPAPRSDAARDPEAAAKLWEISEQMTGVTSTPASRRLSSSSD